MQIRRGNRAMATSGWCASVVAGMVIGTSTVRAEVDVTFDGENVVVSSDGADDLIVDSQVQTGSFARRLFVNDVSVGVISNRIRTLVIQGGPAGTTVAFSADDESQFDLLETVTIRGGAGDDSITATTTNTGGFTIDLSGEAGSDTIVGSDLADTITIEDGIEVVSGGAGDDRYIVDANNNTLQVFIVDTADAGGDSMQVIGTFAEDNIIVDPTFIRVNNVQIDYDRAIEAIEVVGGASNDRVTVFPSVTTAFDLAVDSGLNDRLIYDTRGLDFNTANGLIQTTGFAPVTHNGFDVICITELAIATDCNTNGLPDACEPSLAPRITDQPSARSICVGGAATFDVEATGIEPITYQWRRDGVPIEGETSSSFAVASGTLDDAGDYDVVVGSACGSITSIPVRLSVTSAPIITTQPEDAALMVGDDHTFVVSGGGVGGVDIQWRFNGAPIPGATSIFLQINGITLDDAGVYDAVLTDDCGVVVSRGATLSVVGPPRVLQEPVSAVVCLGDSFVLAVIADGTPPLQYQWRRNGQDVPGQTASTLDFPSFAPPDAATYDVRITNTLGQTTSQPAVLTLALPVTITSQPQSQTRCVGSTVTLTVAAEGTSPIVYQWRRNGQPISGANDETLVLTNVAIADSGDYDVAISNLCGTAFTQSVPLNIEACPTTRFVDATATGLNNGSSWANAYTDLQDALTDATVAGNVDEIRIAEGTYTPGDSRTDTFSIPSDTTVLGGYPAGGGQRDVDANVTVLSGDLASNDPQTDENAFHVVTIDTNGGDVIVDGCTISGGNANGGPNDDIGGGVLIDGSNPTFRSCTFDANFAAADGAGAVCAGDESPIFEMCHFLNNVSGDRGGGLFLGSGNGIVDTCIFEDNVADRLGGGLFVLDGAATVIGSRFERNGVVSGFGGGCCLDDGNPAVLTCDFIENDIVGSGAGVFAARGRPLIDRCYFFANNCSSGNGAAIMNQQAVSLVTNSIFVGNFTTGFGGAFFGFNNTPPTLLNCTMYLNIATGGGGAVASGFGSQTNVVGSIMWNNFTGQTSGVVNTSYSCVQGGAPGDGNISNDPRFTDPIGPDGLESSGDEVLSLTGSSPCIDAGDNDTFPNQGGVLDFSGNARFVDIVSVVDSGRGNSPIVDMGAIERPSSAALMCDWNQDNESSIADLLAYLSMWVDADSEADIAAPLGTIDMLDLLAFLDAWVSCGGS